MPERPESPGNPLHEGGPHAGGAPVLDRLAALRASADATLDHAADALRAHVEEAATLVDPFPSFPGAVFAYGIEVEPAGGGDPGLGCVILGNDGRLYELHIGLDGSQSQTGVPDASTERHEALVPLDVRPEVFVRYARAALDAVAAHLEAGPHAEG